MGSMVKVTDIFHKSPLME